MSSSSDGFWSLNDICGNVIAKKKDECGNLSCIAVHPDGLILATGSSSGIVKIWDIRTGEVAFECPELFTSPVISCSFSENGYYFATASSSCVKIWDLRKLIKVHEIESNDSLKDVKFDPSGAYLVLGGGNGLR